jgi:hypothetical protein
MNVWLKLSMAGCVISMLSGCARNYEWFKPGMTNAGTSQDALECNILAKQNGGTSNWTYGLDPHIYELCMQGRGYEMKSFNYSL